jgi:hypothetical protein
MKKLTYIVLLTALPLTACETFRPEHSSIANSLQIAMAQPIVPTTVMMPEEPKKN